MYDFHFREMAEQLVVDGVLPQQQKDAAITSLQNHWKDRIAHIWSIKDVQGGHNLTDEEAREVLDKVLHKSDCAIGINWQEIYFWAEELFPGCAKEGNPWG